MKIRKCFFILLAALVVPATPVRAYVDAAPTLGRVVKDAATIVVLRVEKVSREKRVVIYTRVAVLKGKQAAGQVKHQITDGMHPREPRLVLDWAEPGQTAVCFQEENGDIVDSLITGLLQSG